MILRAVLRNYGGDGPHRVMIVGTITAEPGEIPEGDTCILTKIETLGEEGGWLPPSGIAADIEGQVRPGMNLGDLLTSDFRPDLTRRIKLPWGPQLKAESQSAESKQGLPVDRLMAAFRLFM